MGNEANVKKLTGSATTTFGSCLMYSISINTALAGTLIVKESGTAVGTFAIATPAGTYHLVPNGARYTNLTIALSAADDVTAFTKVA